MPVSNLKITGSQNVCLNHKILSKYMYLPNTTLFTQHTNISHQTLGYFVQEIFITVLFHMVSIQTCKKTTSLIIPKRKIFWRLAYFNSFSEETMSGLSQPNICFSLDWNRTEFQRDEIRSWCEVSNEWPKYLNANSLPMLCKAMHQILLHMIIIELFKVKVYN